MSAKTNKGVYVCKGKRIHVVYNNVTLHFSFEEFEKFTFMIDDAYHRVKSEFANDDDDCPSDDDSQ